MKVRLETADGGFVVSGVTPPFNEPPHVIFWGTRAFRHYDTEHHEFDGADDEDVYREAFVYWLPHTRTESA